jgi:hypothetical protein
MRNAPLQSRRDARISAMTFRKTEEKFFCEPLDGILCDVPDGQINRAKFSRILLRHRRFSGATAHHSGRRIV